MSDEDSSDPYANSPLYEADPKSIDEIFESFDKKLTLGFPREITDFEIKSCVEYYRKERERVAQAIADGKQMPRKSASTASTPKQKALAALKNLEY